MAHSKDKRRIYLINPENPDNFWAMKGVLNIVGGNKSLMPNVALPTLMSLTPDDIDIEYVLCDENISKIDFNLQCDLVALTGFTLHSDRIAEIYAAFRDRGIKVALGGVFATLAPDTASECCDYLFIGEGEYTWPNFLRDWIKGEPENKYEQSEYVDINDSPKPDLSLLKGKNYVYFPVQTSRGCPNNCDFCDVVRLAGRRYRTKSIEQIMAEVKDAQSSGAETVFFSDDNFVVNREFTIKLLHELIKWNTTLSVPLSFSTQATVMIGADEELLKLMADAHFTVIFIGLETIRDECLKEVNKGQMIKYNPSEVIPKISSYGIVPFLGMIVGFDHDDISIFNEFEEYLQRTSSPIASISVLNAPKGTALFHRMKEEGRLIEDFQGFWHFSTNIIPKQMPLQELLTRHRELFKKIYEPENFEKRLIGWLENVSYFTELYSTKKKNFLRIFKIFSILKHYTFNVPQPVKKSFYRILKKTWKINPRLISKTISIMVQYWHYYDFANKESWIEDAKKPKTPKAD